MQLEPRLARDALATRPCCCRVLRCRLSRAAHRWCQTPRLTWRMWRSRRSSSSSSSSISSSRWAEQATLRGCVVGLCLCCRWLTKLTLLPASLPPCLCSGEHLQSARRGSAPVQQQPRRQLQRQQRRRHQEVRGSACKRALAQQPRGKQAKRSSPPLPAGSAAGEAQQLAQEEAGEVEEDGEEEAEQELDGEERELLLGSTIQGEPGGAGRRQQGGRAWETLVWISFRGERTQEGAAPFLAASPSAPPPSPHVARSRAHSTHGYSVWRRPAGHLRHVVSATCILPHPTHCS